MEGCLMTRDETKQLLMMIQAAFPNYKIPDKSVAVNTWYIMLKDYDYKVVETALRTYIATDTSGFACSIGQIISLIQKCTVQEQLGEMEAWSLVRKEIGRASCRERV